MWLVIEVTPELRWLRLNENLLFENTEATTQAGEIWLRLPIRTCLTPAANLLEVMFVADSQPGNQLPAESPASPRRVIPVEVYLELEEANLDQCDDAQFAI